MKSKTNVYRFRAFAQNGSGIEETYASIEKNFISRAFSIASKRMPDATTIQMESIWMCESFCSCEEGKNLLGERR